MSAPRELQAQCRINTPLGPMTAAATARGLAGLWFDGQTHHPGALDAPENPNHPVLLATQRALQAHFDGAASAGAEALPPMDLQGTPFQRAVWRVLQTIPAGQHRCYGDVALAAGSPAAVRAAGAAIGRNPVSVLVPCHRVIGRSGSLTGYAGGLERKRALLQLEGALPSPAPQAARHASVTAAVNAPSTAALKAPVPKRRPAGAPAP